MSRPGDHGWTTEAEVNFIKGLGTFNPILASGPRTRREWLDRYEQTLELRADWETNNIDKKMVEVKLMYEYRFLKERS